MHLDDDLLEAVRAVLRGEIYLSKPIVALAIKNYVEQAATSGGAIVLPRSSRQCAQRLFKCGHGRPLRDWTLPASGLMGLSTPRSGA